MVGRICELEKGKCKKYVNLYSAPSYEPLKRSGMDHTAFTLQIYTIPAFTSYS